MNKPTSALTKATRQLAIEKALDTVRQVALAMKTTDDLGPVVEATHAALNDLGISPFRTTIAILNEAEDEVRHWSKRDQDAFFSRTSTLSDLRKSGSGYIAPRSGRKRYVMVKWNQRQLVSHMRKYRQAEKDGRTEVERYLKYLVQIAPVPYYQHTFYFSGGQVVLGMDRELDKPEIAIARRVTETFEFAYKRFLDLQQKEQRAREAEVEAALERVRARALGMQESKEVLGVATIMRNEFVDLGYELDRVIIVTDRDEEKGTALLWRALPLTPRDTEFGEPFTFQIGQGPRQKHSRVRTKAGEEAWVNQLDPKEVREIARQDLTSEGYSKAQIEKRVAAIPDPYYTNGVDFGLGMINFGAGFEFSDEDLEIARRFADVFAIAFRRFKELEAKEAQNRELTIQNAIERVRAQAQGMQESNELAGVTKAIYDEFQGLGYDLIRTAVHVSGTDGDPGFTWAFFEGIEDAHDLS